MINAGSSRSRGVRDGGGVGANMQAHKRLVYNPCLPSASLAGSAHAVVGVREADNYTVV